MEVDNTYDVTVQSKHRLIANGFYTSNCSHPDVIEFITAKQNSGRLTKFNLSVNCSDEFMAKVVNVTSLNKKLKLIDVTSEEAISIKKQLEEENKWDLIFPDTAFERYDDEWDGNITAWKAKGYPVIVYNTVSVEMLWNLIIESTYQRNEPGILFLDRANYFNPLNYFETILACNPCIVGDSLVMTNIGEISIKDLCEKIKNGIDVKALTYNIETKKPEYEDIVFADKTRTDAEVIQIELESGEILKLTPDHKVYTENRGYIEASNLTEDDILIVTK